MTDQAQRLQALDPQQSFIVSAPAGSGKTGLITQRLHDALALVDIRLLDHVIVGRGRCVSMAETGDIPVI